MRDPLPLLLALITPLLGGWTTTSWSASGDSPDAGWDADAAALEVVWVGGGAVQRARFGLPPAVDVLLSETVSGTGGESNCWGWGPGIAVSDGVVDLAHKSEVGSWLYDWKASRWTAGGGWSSPVTLGTSQERGYSPQTATDSDGTTIAFQRVSGQVPFAAIDAFELQGGQSVASSVGVVAARADDRLDLVAGPALGERHLFGGVPSPGGQITWARSMDAGGSWSDLGELQAGACGGRVGQPDAVVLPDGSMHVVYGCSEDGDRGGTPSVRHATISGTSVLSDAPITDQGELTAWHLSLGIGRIGATGSGAVLVAAYLTTDGGELRVRTSEDGGGTWSPSTALAAVGGDCEGRNAPAVQSLGDDAVAVVWGDGSDVHLAFDTWPPPGDDDRHGHDLS